MVVGCRDTDYRNHLKHVWWQTLRFKKLENRRRSMAWNLSGIIKRHIRHSGSPLGVYTIEITSARCEFLTKQPIVFKVLTRERGQAHGAQMSKPFLPYALHSATKSSRSFGVWGTGGWRPGLCGFDCARWEWVQSSKSYTWSVKAGTPLLFHTSLLRHKGNLMGLI